MLTREHSPISVTLLTRTQAPGAIPILSALWKIHLFCTAENTPGTSLQEGITAAWVGRLGEASWEGCAATAVPESP